MNPLPMTVISGFLGAGKTTLLNTVLAAPHGLRLTVLVNDFGEIAIDESLIENRTGETIALSNGCVCCSIGGALLDAIDRILDQPVRPDHLVIEASGVADPAKIRQIAVAEPSLHAGPILTLVDATRFVPQSTDPLLADTMVRQIAAADVLLVTKEDLLPAHQHGRCAEAVKSTGAAAPVIAGTPTEIAIDVLKHQLKGSSQPVYADEVGDHATQYATWHSKSRAPVNLQDLQAATHRSVSGTLRLKGHVYATDGHGYRVQVAGDRWSAEKLATTPEVLGIVAIGHRAEFDPSELEAAMQPSHNTAN